MGVQHRYPRASLIGPAVAMVIGWPCFLADVFGLMSAGAAAFLRSAGVNHNLDVPGALLFSVIGGTFAATGGFRLWRRSAVYETDDTGIRIRGSKNAQLKWHDIEEAALSEIILQDTFNRGKGIRKRNEFTTLGARHAYYPEGHPLYVGGGWLRLRLKGRGTEIMVESPLSGFRDILGRTAELIAGGRIQAGQSTRRNLTFLGYSNSQSASRSG